MRAPALKHRCEHLSCLKSKSRNDGLKPYLPDELEIEAFKALSVFDEPEDVARVGLAPAVTTCHMLDQGRSLQIDVGTVASMKGEAHSASLVLESYGGISRKFDVALGLEYIAGGASKASRDAAGADAEPLRGNVASNEPAMSCGKRKRRVSHAPHRHQFRCCSIRHCAAPSAMHRSARESRG